MPPEATLASEAVPRSGAVTHGTTVAVYDTHRAAEEAIRALEKTGFNMRKVSIVGKDCGTEGGVVGYYNAGARVRAWGREGTFWGGLWGTLFGSALFVTPDAGPLFAAGPLVARMVEAMEGTSVGGGLSALGASLHEIGIVGDRILAYQAQIRAGKLVVVVHGTRGEAAKSQTILANAEQHEAPSEHCCR